MAEAPAPLVPEDVDLRDFAFMPLDVARLRDSDIAALANGDEFRAAVLLWCASWHQVPAASLPNDDAVLCRLAGYGRVVKEWLKVKDGALRGWILASDGRLYHAVIAEKANEAWQAKLRQRWASECARIKKHNQRHPQDEVTAPTFEEWMSQRNGERQSQRVPKDSPEPVPRDSDKCPPAKSRDTRSKGQGQGQGELKNNSSDRSSHNDHPERQGAAGQDFSRDELDRIEWLIFPEVAGLPVALNQDISPIVGCYQRGATDADVVNGIRAAIGSGMRPTRWKAFPGWIDRAVADRTAAPTSQKSQSEDHNDIIARFAAKNGLTPDGQPISN